MKLTLFLMAALALAAGLAVWGVRQGHGGDTEFILLAAAAALLPATAYFWSLWAVIRPVRVAAHHMARLAAGDCVNDVAGAQLARGDEIGQLARAAQQLIEYRRSEVGAANSMAAGDFTARLLVRGEDDTLGQAIERMAAATYEGLDRIAIAAERVRADCREAGAAAGEIAAGGEAAAGALGEAAASANSLGRNASQNAVAAKEIAELTAAGVRVVERGYDEVGEMGGVMLEMQSCGGKIVGIAKAIGDIAFQTNLLALNASVEAARAGRHGRGFTIVAQEVRRLSERTSLAASETSTMMKETVRQVELAAAIVGKINATFGDISGHVGEIDAHLAGITDGCGRQALDGEKINSLLRDLEAMAREDRGRAAGLSDNAAALTGGAEELLRAVGWFRNRGGSRYGGNGRRRRLAAAGTGPAGDMDRAEAIARAIKRLE